MKEEYTTIDLLKFFFAVCIVGLHTGLLHTEESMTAWLVWCLLFRTAVPFFFVVSGYFLAGKIRRADRSCKKGIQEIRQITKRYCKKLIPPLAFWGGLGLIIDILNRLRKSEELADILFYAFRTIFYPENAMWFLLALIVGAFLVTEIYVRVKKWYIFWLIFSLAGYTFVLLCNNYYFLIEGTFFGMIAECYVQLFVSARNGVFLAPYFLGVGFLLQSERVKRFFCKNKYWVWTGLLLGTILFLLEAYCIYGRSSLDDRGAFIALLLFVPCLVEVSLLYQAKLPLPYRSLRRLSTSIYYTHRTVRVVLMILPFYNGNTTVLFLETLTVSILISMLSYRIRSDKVHAIFG